MTASDDTCAPSVRRTVLQGAILPARTGRSFHLDLGESIEITNTHGQQVVDTWAIDQTRPEVVLSMSHTHMALGRLTVRRGDVLHGSDRMPMLEITEDSSGEVHDTLVPACDQVRYQQLGVEGYHDNCVDNFGAALRDVLPEWSSAVWGRPALVPAPLNLFMNVPVGPDGRIRIEEPADVPGGAVTLRALRPLIVVLSACPQDLAPTNGRRQAPRDVGVTVYGREERAGR